MIWGITKICRGSHGALGVHRAIYRGKGGRSEGYINIWEKTGRSRGLCRDILGESERFTRRVGDLGVHSKTCRRSQINNIWGE